MAKASTRFARMRRAEQDARPREAPRRIEYCYGKKCGAKREVAEWSAEPYYCESCKPLPTEPVYAGRFSPARPELHRINVDEWKVAKLSLNRRVKASPPGERPGPFAFMAECGEYVFINSLRKYEPDEIAAKPRCEVCFGGTK